MLKASLLPRISMEVILTTGLLVLSRPAQGQETTSPKPVEASGKISCQELMTTVGGGSKAEKFSRFCEKAQKLPDCASVEGTDIYHSDHSEKAQKGRGRRILVLGLIHGDEPNSGILALEWAMRLSEIEHRNIWRIVPVLNPDGLRRNQRMNARDVDLNRNFPTKDWDPEATKYWKRAMKSDPRRFPGEKAASEPETRCAVSHIKDFKPDFIISIHTPYGVLDFDGPKALFPKYAPLPWRALGNFPGSLGRYMWKDHQLPVLTVELKDSRMEDPAKIQDVLGGFVIQVARMTGSKPSSMFELL